MPPTNKILVRCPDCLKKGKIRNLAEVLPNGWVKVQRFVSNKPNGTGEVTLIHGYDFILKCGECFHDVYFKQERREDAVSDIRRQWLSGQGFGSAFGSL